jgi:hypothetical protein
MRLFHPHYNCLHGIESDQLDMYHIFFPFVEIYDVRTERYYFEPDDRNKDKYSFCANISDRICLFHLGLELKENGEFSWWAGNSDSRTINGVDDMILATAIAYCLRENIEEIRNAAKKYNTTARWRYKTLDIIQKVKAELIEDTKENRLKSMNGIGVN